MKRALTLAALIGLSVSGVSHGQIDPMAPWPTANHDYQNTSRSPFIGPESVKVKWSVQVGKTAWGPTVGRDGTIYVPSSDGFLYAFRQDGTEKWKFDLVGMGKNTAQNATVAKDGTIYCTGTILFAVNPDGTEKWRFEKPGFDGFQTPTLGPDNTIYQGSRDGTLYAIDATASKAGDVKVKWSKQYTAGVRIQSPISFTKNGDPLIGLRKGAIPNVMRLNPVDGEPRWSFQGPDEMRTPTVGDDGTLFVASRVADVFALNPENGQPIWNEPKVVRDPATAVIEFPALSPEGNLYVGSGNGEVLATKPNGEELWRFHPEGIIDPVTSKVNPIHMGTPVVDATGKLFVTSPLADFWTINPVTGKQIQHLDLPDATQALFTRAAMGADGTIYSGSLSGVIYAFGDDLVLGDVNGNKTVDVSDAVASLRKAIGVEPTTPQDIRALDVNVASEADGRPFGDGKITVTDAVSILQQVVSPRANWPYPAN